MRTTLDLSDDLFREAKQRAAAAGESLTRLIERALRLYLMPQPASAEPGYRFEPIIKGGGALEGVDWDSRDSLYEHMEGRR